MKSLALALVVLATNQVMALQPTCSEYLGGHTACSVESQNMQYVFQKDCTLLEVTFDGHEVKSVRTGYWTLLGKEKLFSSFEGKANLDTISFDQKNEVVLINGTPTLKSCK